MGKFPFLKIGAKLLVQQADREDRALAKANPAEGDGLSRVEWHLCYHGS